VPEARLMADEYLAGAEGVAGGYLAPSGVDVVIASIALSGLVSCEASRVSRRARIDGAAERCTQ
jgi:hypothetical protein